MSNEDISLTNFIDLTDNNKLMVLNWRNNENIRKWMYNSDIISEEDHFIFIKTLKKDETKQYYLVSQKDSYIGVIYFTDIDVTSKQAEFGIYSDPSLKGNGKALMSTICEYGFKKLNLNKIIAEVFENNRKAIQLYKNFNFQNIGSKTLDRKIIICMELENENR